MNLYLVWPSSQINKCHVPITDTRRRDGESSPTMAATAATDKNARSTT